MPDQTPDHDMSELEKLLTSRESAAVLGAILDNNPSFVVLNRAPDGKILRFNDTAAQILGRRRGELEGRSVTEIAGLLPAYDMSGRPLREDERPTYRALRGEVVTGFEFLAEAADGERIPVAVNAAPIRNARGEVIGSISSAADLRPYKSLEQDLREAAAQRETLYRELTHRVKNHLHIMSGMISLEARDPKMTAKELAALVKGRLHALAAVYDGMTLAGIGARVGAAAFLEEVCRPYASDAVCVETAVDPTDLTLGSDQAGPVGMLVNEAVSNSYKHAFPERCGLIRVALRRLAPGQLRLEIADDGVGWRPEAKHRASHGLDLMRLFARQLSGELELVDRPGGGAVVATAVPELAGGAQG
jgi:PAS domain S-box-containing protein